MTLEMADLMDPQCVYWQRPEGQVRLSSRQFSLVFGFGWSSVAWVSSSLVGLEISEMGHQNYCVTASFRTVRCRRRHRVSAVLLSSMSFNKVHLENVNSLSCYLIQFNVTSRYGTRLPIYQPCSIWWD